MARVGEKVAFVLDIQQITIPLYVWSPKNFTYHMHGYTHTFTYYLFKIYLLFSLNL